MPEALIKSPCGCLLTTEQARTIRALLNASERRTKGGGKPPSCTCGTCRKCRAREAQRRRRAEEKSK